MNSERDERFKEIVQSQRPRLLSIIRNMLRDSVEAEDVVQEVFVEYLQAYDLGYVIESLSSWLVTVARNKILDRFRRRRTQAEHQQEILDSAEVSTAFDESAWLRKEILSAIELLPQDQQQVFIAHEIEGKSFEELSKKWGVSVNTLLSRKRYAVQFLRNYLKEIHNELE